MTTDGVRPQSKPETADLTDKELAELEAYAGTNERIGIERSKIDTDELRRLLAMARRTREADALLVRAEDRLSSYRLACPCSGEACVSDCRECAATRGLVNEIRDARRGTP